MRNMIMMSAGADRDGFNKADGLKPEGCMIYGSTIIHSLMRTSWPAALSSDSAAATILG
jgi:hypothetical protein